MCNNNEMVLLKYSIILCKFQQLISHLFSRELTLLIILEIQLENQSENIAYCLEVPRTPRSIPVHRFRPSEKCRLNIGRTSVHHGPLGNENNWYQRLMPDTCGCHRQPLFMTVNQKARAPRLECLHTHTTRHVRVYQN